MYKFQRLMEKIGSIVIVVIIVGFSIGFGILVKKELIDRDFSSDVENVQDKKEDNKNDNKKEETVDNKKEENKDDKKEDTGSKKEENTSNDKEDNSVSSGSDVEYKVYPIVVCSMSSKVEDTEMVEKEAYTAYFENDGNLRWIEYESVTDFSKDMETYNQLFEIGFFDELYKEMKDIAHIEYNSTNFKMSYEIDQNAFLTLNSDYFKSKSDLKYDSLKRIFSNNGFSCKDE